jgi:hypothetical protein
MLLLTTFLHLRTERMVIIDVTFQWYVLLMEGKAMLAMSLIWITPLTVMEMVVPQCAPKALALIRGLGSPSNSHVRCFTSSAGKQF